MVNELKCKLHIHKKRSEEADHESKSVNVRKQNKKKLDEE
jgi:hypothetical protein